MAQKNFGQIRRIMPADGKKIQEFNYLQVGGSGDVAIKFKQGPTTIITGNLLDRIGVVPIGEADEVLLSGTSATEIYVW